MRDWRPIEFVVNDVYLLKECGERLRALLPQEEWLK